MYVYAPTLSAAVLVDSKKSDNVGMVQFLSDLLGAEP